MKFPPPHDLAPLAGSAAAPLYRQIYARFRDAIAKGVLKPGGRIPAARALAKELGVARGTVETAYALLGAEGYIQPRGQAGTIVTPGLKPQAAAVAAPAAARTATVDAWLSPAALLPFQMGMPALDAFPRKLWARLGARYLRGMQAADLMYPPPHGLPALRTAIAAHLQVARGIQCAPEQVFVTTGYRGSLQLIAQTLLQAGARAWVEDPGYPPTRELLAQAGIDAAPVAVDADGMQVAQGLAQHPDAQAAIVTPAHQSPLCMSLSLPRRQALLDWARQRKAWIVEDDYDGEYRYASRPLPALKSLDRHGRVLYSGSFSKVLFPGIRLAYLVVPTALVPRFEHVNQVLGAGAPGLAQAMVSQFMTEGHFARHIQRMRKLYAERRQATAAGLAAAFGSRMHIDPQPGGMHLVVRLAGRASDARLADRMLEHGLYAQALSRWSSAMGPRGLMLSFTNIASRQQAEEFGRRIVALL